MAIPRPVGDRQRGSCSRCSRGSGRSSPDRGRRAAAPGPDGKPVDVAPTPTERRPCELVAGLLTVELHEHPPALSRVGHLVEDGDSRRPCRLVVPARCLPRGGACRPGSRLVRALGIGGFLFGPVLLVPAALVSVAWVFLVVRWIAYRRRIAARSTYEPQPSTDTRRDALDMLDEDPALFMCCQAAAAAAASISAPAGSLDFQ